MAKLPTIDVTEVAGAVAREALKAVAAEVNAQATIEDLLRLPGEIAVLEREICDRQLAADAYRRDTLATAKEMLALAEIAAQMEAPDEALNGKNAETRKRAMDAHLAQDPEIQAAKEGLRVAEANAAGKDAGVEVLRVTLREKVNLFSALRHAADLQAQLLRLFGQAGE